MGYISGMSDSIDEQIRSTLRGFPEVEFAILFGSLAEGRANAESDVDLGVASTNPAWNSSRKMALQEQLVLATGRPVDLIDLCVTQGPVLHECHSKGRILIGANSAAHDQAILRMTWWEQDCAPAYRAGLDRIIRKEFLENRA